MAELGSFTSRGHAEMAAGMLEAHGIPARALGDDAGGAIPHVALGMHGYRVGVPDDRAEEARELLAATEDPDTDPGPGRGPAPTWVTAGRLVLVVLVAALLLALVVNGVDDVLGTS